MRLTIHFTPLFAVSCGLSVSMPASGTPNIRLTLADDTVCRDRDPRGNREVRKPQLDRLGTQ